MPPADPTDRGAPAPEPAALEPVDGLFAARVRDSFARQGLMATLGAELAEISPGFCEIRLPFRDAVSQQHGFFHAGATGAIADSAGGYAAYSLMGPGDTVLSVDYKLNLLAPARGELLIARGRVLRAGATLTVCRVDVFAVRGGEETLCAAMQQSCIRTPTRAGRAAG